MATRAFCLSPFEPVQLSRRQSRRARRFRTHVAVGSASLIATAAVFTVIPSDDAVFRASMATAYVGLALFAITLAFGPLASLRGWRYPLSTDIRRDIGIWSGGLAIAHVVLGLQVHLKGKMWEYFVHSVNGRWLPRIDPFGGANYTGLAAGLIFLALLVTSNDASLKAMGATGWRRLHGLATAALVLTLIHGAAYQWIEARPWGYVVLFVVLAAFTLGPRIVRPRTGDR
jgi:methionine sulfoxide reductase heme-binding subunit